MSRNCLSLRLASSARARARCRHSATARFILIHRAVGFSEIRFVRTVCIVVLMSDSRILRLLKIHDLRLGAREFARDQVMIWNGSDTVGASEPFRRYWERVCKALTSAALSALPPIAHSPLATSYTRTQVTPRIASPLTSTMALVTLLIIACFWLLSKTPSMRWISTSGMTVSFLGWLLLLGVDPMSKPGMTRSDLRGQFRK